ncbi:zinc finger protein 836 [Sebastes umbrosus]|uniref:zinc finger protein 836 n=1 Tax=Sebastes umbrosus TaxID=72105 RepID=UPI00189FF95B|nr:zinc finger protein 836 [Sebastes umbrosus]
MSEDSSSDDEWCLSTEKQGDDAHPGAQCWECGKKFSKIKCLMSHYKSHDIEATCHICRVTFRRLTSLFMHLDNVHSPPLCKRCDQYFSNTWELNKHAETYCVGSTPFREAPSLISAAICRSQNNDNFHNDVTAQQSTKSVLRDSVSEVRPQQRIERKPERAGTSDNSIEYIVIEDDDDVDMESDREKADDSTSTESDGEDKTRRSKPANSCPDDPESDGGSSSSDSSSDSSHTPHTKTPPAALPKTPPAALPIVTSIMCDACGRGPFRAMKLHLRHCSGIRVKYQCSVCKMIFLTETPLKEHYMPLYSCQICGQVFSQKDSYLRHQCPKGTKSPLVLFCSESMPKACKICKSFFTSEKTLLNHVTRVHTSVVSTKVCIITNPPGFHGTAAHSAIRNPNVVNRVMNGNLRVGQTYAGSLSTFVKSSPSSRETSYSHAGGPASIRMASSAAPFRSGRNGALGPTNQPLRRLSAPLFVPPVATDTTPATAAPDPVTPPMLTIMALFENDRHDVALTKGKNRGWRAKTPYPCRQCGAISRQPSHVISHRYLHRGHRPYQCQCGRAFKHQLHLLRHCVQHAETVSYICVSCGESFTGAKLLTEHMKGKSRKKSRSGRTWKVKRKCRMSLTCDCGQLFFRPSAYIWHLLKNRTKTKRLKQHLE